MNKVNSEERKIIAGQHAKKVSQEALSNALSNHGMSIERLVGVLAEELAATEQRTYYEYGKKDKPGTFVYSKEFPSHPTRLKAVKMGLELHNAFPDKEIGVKHSADEALISYVGQAMRANEDSDSD